MAESQAAASGHPDMDYAEHERTYRNFLTGVKWSVIHLVILLVLMAYFLL